jgi:ketosteroid isomerase-like protein
VYRITFSNKPQMKFDIRKVIPAGDDLALVIVSWTSVLSSDEAKVLSGTATDIVRRQADGTWKLVLDNPYGVG